jgi:SpoVK/Ycf46/Vps4 family AAA+-type ATPase
VHMFLGELSHMLSEAIHQDLLRRYARDATRARDPVRRSWEEDVMDTAITLDGQPSSVKTMIEKHMLIPMLEELSSQSRRRVSLPVRRSALLFGPPGTSKTRVVRAFAEAIGWPFVEINPSHFLTSGLNNIYGQTNEVFDDLLDLSGAVVLFDELDALVRRRPGSDQAPLDVTREFLTTSMLPKLIELHDRGRVFYFMATNHRDIFDEAITRSGRFDLHVFMGVPTWSEKLAELERFLPMGFSPVAKDEVDYVRDKIDAWVSDRDELSRLLDWFSFGETKALFEDFVAGRTSRRAVDAEGAARQFELRVRFFAEKRIGLRAVSTTGAVSDARREYEADRNESRVQ